MSKKCEECVKKAGGKWDSTAESDLSEGMCPKKRNDEVYTCEKTGRRLRANGKVHLIA